MPSFDCDGKAGAVVFAQYGPIGSNVIVIAGSTVMLMVVGLAHSPALGVKVYNVVPGIAEENAGDQVPEMPSIEVAGNGLGPFWQIELIAAKVGVMIGVIITGMVIGLAHCPGSGVKT